MTYQFYRKIGCLTRVFHILTSKIIVNEISNVLFPLHNEAAGINKPHYGTDMPKIILCDIAKRLRAIYFYE